MTDLEGDSTIKVTKAQAVFLRRLLDGGPMTVQEALSESTGLQKGAPITRLFRNGCVARKGRGKAHDPFIYRITDLGKAALDRFTATQEWGGS
ncbi:hypothetical protein ACFOPQ_01375 [Deinococcus antarcticus]|uniref:MarR family protein n=1 Tax=Deinococcus antarcticus TaxID=1298767 RepID=A0ABV8A2G7_9DEIO